MFYTQCWGVIIFDWQVELELAINTNSANYYIPRGEQIATDVDARTKGASAAEKDSYYTRFVYLCLSMRGVPV